MLLALSCHSFRCAWRSAQPRTRTVTAPGEAMASLAALSHPQEPTFNHHITHLPPRSGIDDPAVGALQDSELHDSPGGMLHPYSIPSHPTAGSILPLPAGNGRRKISPFLFTYKPPRTFQGHVPLSWRYRSLPSIRFSAGSSAGFQWGTAAQLSAQLHQRHGSSFSHIQDKHQLLHSWLRSSKQAKLA